MTLLDKIGKGAAIGLGVLAGFMPQQVYADSGTDVMLYVAGEAFKRGDVDQGRAYLEMARVSAEEEGKRKAKEQAKKEAKEEGERQIKNNTFSLSATDKIIFSGRYGEPLPEDCKASIKISKKNDPNEYLPSNFFSVNQNIKSGSDRVLFSIETKQLLERGLRGRCVVRIAWGSWKEIKKIVNYEITLLE